MKTFNNVRFIIQSPFTSTERVIYCVSAEFMELVEGQEIEITWSDMGEIAEYKIINAEERWDMSDKLGDTRWKIYTLKYIPNSSKDIDSDE